MYSITIPNTPYVKRVDIAFTLQSAQKIVFYELEDCVLSIGVGVGLYTYAAYHKYIQSMRDIEALGVGKITESEQFVPLSESLIGFNQFIVINNGAELILRGMID